MSARVPRILIPEPNALNASYSRRSWPGYAEAVTVAGGQPVRLELKSSLGEQAQLLAGCQGVLLPGSSADVNPEKYGMARLPQCNPADPLREAADELLLQDAFHLHKPILGVCYGLQSLNVWRGGSLIQDLSTRNMIHRAPDREGRAHRVRIAADSALYHFLKDAEWEGQSVWTNSSHHQAIDRVGDGLSAVAWSEDGVVEGVESTTAQFVLGVQWHPERMVGSDEGAKALFRGFVDAARAWRDGFR